MKSLFAAVLLLLLCAMSNAQTYHPMLRTDVLWEVHWQNSGGPNWVQYTPTWLWIDTINDLVVDSNRYHYLAENGNANGYYLREDTATRQVFWLDTVSNTELLLYDFGLEVGDSIYFHDQDSPFQAGWHYVTSKNTVQIEGTDRVRLNFATDPISSTLCAEPWTEGVGINAGPFWFMQGDCWHYQSVLFCYRQRDGMSLTNLLNGGICTPVGLNEPAASPTGLSLQPNPATDRVLVEATQHLESIAIYNTQGQLMLTQSPRSNGLQHELDVSALPAGMYVVRVASNGKHHTHRLIKHTHK